MEKALGPVEEQLDQEPGEQGDGQAIVESEEQGAAHQHERGPLLFHLPSFLPLPSFSPSRAARASASSRFFAASTFG